MEFALAFLIFMLLALGLSEGAMLAWNIGTLEHALHDGVRKAILPSTPNEATVETEVINSAVGLNLTATDITVRVNGNPTCTSGSTYGATRAKGDVIRVCASYTYTPMFTTVLTGPLTVSRQAESRAE